MRTIADNSKQVARNFYEGYSTHDLSTVFDKYISKDLVNHAMGGALSRQTWLDYDTATLGAIPDLKATVLEQVAEENKVVTHRVFEGTHTADFMGKPATENSVRLEAITIDLIRDGQIVEHNIVGDISQFMQSFETE